MHSACSLSLTAKRIFGIIFAEQSMDGTTKGQKTDSFGKCRSFSWKCWARVRLEGISLCLLPLAGLRITCLRMMSSTLQVDSALTGRLERHSFAYVNKRFLKIFRKQEMGEVSGCSPEARRAWGTGKTLPWERQWWGWSQLVGGRAGQGR